MTENEFKMHTRKALTSRFLWKYHSDIAGGLNIWDQTDYLIQASKNKRKYLKAYILAILMIAFGIIVMGAFLYLCFFHMDFLRSGLPSGNDTAIR
jgi:hypothetical protein